MPSIIPGYNYDIFISYRQKDNKHDGWVTEFVQNLKDELGSTFKEEISVYFDVNPHDGILETYDVDASLKDKLKCLIFIPIISRTYCDPKSFAWEHEFKAFVELASKDQLGLKVKLSNGNVASRVLPITIHDLDQQDIRDCEMLLYGVLRGIEFIYKEPGVNRPLRGNEDHPHDNINKTYYRDQINKVANTIKEIITGITISESSQGKNDIKEEKRIFHSKTSFRKVIIVAFILLIPIAGYFIKSSLSLPGTEMETSIAVLPFINDSPDKEGTDYIVNGLLVEIINNLQQIKSISRVLPRTSVEKYRLMIKPAAEIAKELNVNYILNGNVQKIGNKLVLRIELIDAKNDKPLKSYPFNEMIETPEQIFNIYSEVSQSVANDLQAQITPEEKEQIEKTPTKNLTALDFYQRAKAEEINFTKDENNPSLKRAEENYRKALSYDSTFAAAYAGLAMVNAYKRYNKEYYAENFLDSFLILINKSLSLDHKLAEAYFLKGQYYLMVGNPQSALREFDDCLKFNPNYWQAYDIEAKLIYGVNCKDADLIKSIVSFEKAISLNHGVDRANIFRSMGDVFGAGAGFTDIAIAYYKNAFSIDNDSLKYFSSLAGAYSLTDSVQAEKYSRKWLNLNPGDMDALFALSDLLVMKGDLAEALSYCSRYAVWVKNNDKLAAGSMHRIGYAYWITGNKQEAEFWFRRQKNFDLKTIENNRYAGSVAPTSYYDLACVYAFEGKKDSAYLYLRKLDEMKVFPFWWNHFIKTDPLLENLREDSEFQNLVNRLESKYKYEHERVKKWMEENGRI